MEHRNGQRLAADMPDLRERLSAVNATVEQFEAFTRTVAAGGITHSDLRVIAPYRPSNIETKEA